MTERRCENCRWCSYPFPYHHDDQIDTAPIGYKCQRRAPVPTGGQMSPAWTMWPRVHANEFCGEFEARLACPTCEGGGWECYGLGRNDPHFRECSTCGNPERLPSP